MTKRRFCGILMVAFINFCQVSFSQKIAVLIPEKSSVIIKGTSTLHNWEEKALIFDCKLTLTITENQIISIENILFTCASEGIESGNSLMNSKTYDALKSKKFPQIKFSYKNIEKLNTVQNKFSLLITGDLYIAGVNQHVTIPVIGTIQNNIIQIEGSKDLILTDFGISPPTAVLGTIKTGNQITVSYTFAFKL